MTENLIITELPRRRRRAPAGVKTFLIGCAAAGGVGSLVDSVIGQPVCLAILIVGFGVWRFWPTGR